MNIHLTGAMLLLTFAGSLGAQDSDVDARLKKLERDNKELERRLELLAQSQEDAGLAGLFPELGEGENGLGPAASKVFGVSDGVSLGGYGEARYRDNRGGGDSLDFLRSVIYFGYRFDERWVFNSEIEFEHASTEEAGAASVEFAFLDYEATEDTHVRAGLLLTPLGFINEWHEPPTYLGVTRPETERRILPSTWREVGVGVVGDQGPFSYRAYVMGGFEGSGFSAAGLRGGRSSGSKASAEDLALALRVDYVELPGAVFGAGLYRGNSGQGDPALGSTATTIVELHGEYKTGPWWSRALVARATVDDVAKINALNTNGPTESVGEELLGGYLELGYDVMPLLDSGSEAMLSPYVRYESINTQRELPAGLSTDPKQDDEILTMGLHWQPIPGIAIKLDFQDYDNNVDRVNLSMGYSF